MLCRTGAIAGGAELVDKRETCPGARLILCPFTGWAEVKTVRETVVTAPGTVLLT
jgi:hypothetical protein